MLIQQDNPEDHADVRMVGMRLPLKPLLVLNVIIVAITALQPAQTAYPVHLAHLGFLSQTIVIANQNIMIIL